MTARRIGYGDAREVTDERQEYHSGGGAQKQKREGQSLTKKTKRNGSQHPNKDKEDAVKV